VWIVQDRGVKVRPGPDPSGGESRLGTALWRSRTGLVTALVAVVGTLASVTAWVVLEAARDRTAAAALDRRTALVVEAVGAATGRYLDTVTTLAAGVGAVDTLTATRFAQMVQPLHDLRLAGATSISLLVPAADEEITDVQRLWRSRGVTDLTLAPAGVGHEHAFVVLSVPLDGSAQTGLGLDGTGSPAAAAALNEARRADSATVSDAYHLIRDQRLPPDRRQLSFVLTAPVHGPAGADGRRPFLGWITMGLRGQDFVTAALARAGQGLVGVVLSAPAADGNRPTVATLHSTGRPGLAREVQVRVGDRHWHLDVRADAARLSDTGTAVPAAIGGGLLLLTVLLTTLVWVLATRGARARALLEAGTEDLRRAEGVAREQAGLLSTVLNSLGEGVGVVGPDGRFLLHNPAARTMLGIPDFDGIENRQREFGLFLEDGSEPFPTEELPLARALRGESVDQVRMLIRNPARPAGTVISVSARPLESENRGAVAVFRDITDRARAGADLAAATQRLRHELEQRQAAEADLEAQKDYLTQILDTLDVTVITCDVDGTIVHANRTARTALTPGVVTVAEALPVLRMSHPDGSPMTFADTPLARALRGEEVTGAEAVLTLPTGDRRHIVMHARPLRDTAGRITGAVGSSYNITQLREREAELAMFAGVVAHDLRSPLTTVRGFTELVRNSLAADLATDPDRAEHIADLDRVLDSTARMAELISDLLAYTAAGDKPLTVERVDLHGLVADVVAARTTAASVDPDLLVPQVYVAPLPPVRADQALLRQVLDNLVGNAVKYTPPGRPARVDVTAHLDGDTVTVEVADRGIGIPAGQHHAIFGSFHRAHAEGYAGTGLGLAICHRIVERHGGTISAHDNPGGGTVVRLTLPAASEQVGLVASAAG
jgi:signal transduction histidine kinase